ncbi:hypothetical protein CRES_1904 [Corynebacterium resistens DSM 45100]|uniref:Uncharacterized protein n=2 Tax=Corynebacterium resistens TaxID=258224 RepID=F8E2N4_CORRG|nr:hypothetical protein CRES_1904 [Corynebacterium resistens DSM 45100]
MRSEYELGLIRFNETPQWAGSFIRTPLGSFFTRFAPQTHTMEPMSMKTRLFAAFTLFIGAALFVAGWLLPGQVSKSKPVPLNLAASTLFLKDPSATIGPAFQGPDAKKSITAPVHRQFNLLMGEPATEDEASARVGVSTSRMDVEDDLKSLLNAEVWSFTIDRRTGEAKGDAKVADTPATPPTESPMEGYWAKFPQETQKQAYPYFDQTLRKAVSAEFKGTVNRTNDQGRETELYVFRQTLEPTNVAKLYPGVRHEVTMEKDGKQVKGYLTHSGWREITVEPCTGLIVSVEEKIDDVYVSDKGEEVGELLRFHGKTNQPVEQAMLAQALVTSGKRDTQTWGVVLMVAGAIVAAASVVIVLWPGRRRKSRVRDEETESHAHDKA